MTGVDGGKRPPRIASNARRGPGSTLDTSQTGHSEAPHRRLIELQEQVAQLQWELRTARLREELAELGLSRPKIGSRALKKKRAVTFGESSASRRR